MTPSTSPSTNDYKPIRLRYAVRKIFHGILTHALFIQAIQLQPLRGRRARGSRPGNPLHGIQGMDEDAICTGTNVNNHPATTTPV